MSTLIVFTLVVVSVVLALLVALAIFVGGRLHAAVFPYYVTLGCKLISAAGLVSHRLGLRALTFIPEPTFRTLGEHRVENFAKIRDAFVALDELPTVRRGLAALRLPSTLDAQIRRGRLDAPGITHPLQQPYFFVPGVPARTYYDSGAIEWLRALEDGFPIVRDELAAVLATDARAEFKEYTGEFGHRVGGWNAFNLFLLGERVEDNCARCPRTTRLLESLPRVDRLHVMFSALNPGRRISRHFGPMNGLLRAHLPLIVPAGCGLRVGGEEATWQEGRMLVFDDSFEHEVWNDSDRVRVVLFLSFWHPCFADEELPALQRLREVLSSEILLHGEWKLRQETAVVSTLRADTPA